MRAFQFQQPNNGPWLVRTFEMVRTTAEDKAEQLFEAMDAPQWASSVDMDGDTIKATFTHEGHTDTVAVKVTLSSTLISVLDELEYEFCKSIEQIERMNAEHTQGY